MSAYFETTQPKQLLADFDSAIKIGNAKGGITTWKKLVSGYYTHTSSQWENEAFFLPAISANRLTFNIVKPNSKSITTVAYAYYHGHIIETMLSHFDKQFTVGSATALQAPGDRLS
ncbi:hypothetical protein PX554_13875 [Sphingomonas sp. H39-1-10]|uniref:hypothetical protein n=1 Tax=Sphingomonas pollutisoli TaxID=3030829 RepID=UPI0023B92015|nr:hypothetical protein [Sphingomonas pollutisoli]MDF0489225.1 hypothetical protein [Sphingomonas pollutisoli]